MNWMLSSMNFDCDIYTVVTRLEKKERERERGVGGHLDSRLALSTKEKKRGGEDTLP